MNAPAGGARAGGAMLVACVLVALVALAWLIWPGSPAEAALGNPDVLYHLHRVQRCLDDFPFVAPVDSYSHAGRLDRLHWLAPFTLGLASLARLVAPAGAGVRELAEALGFLPPLLGAVTAVLVTMLARRLGADVRLAATAGLLAALSGDAASVFHHGVLDHHGMTAACIALAALARACASWPLWAGACAVMFATTPEATAVVTVLVAVVAGAAVVERIHGEPSDLDGRVAAWCISPAAGAAAALALARMLEPPGAPPAPWLGEGAFTFSLAHVAWTAAVGGAGALVLGAARRGSTRGRRGALAAGAAVALAGALLAGLAATHQLAPIATRLARAARQPVGEETSPLRLFIAEPGSHWASWSVLLAVVLVACVVRVAALVRRGSAGPWSAFATLLALAAVVLAVAEMRHARAFAPIVALAVVMLARDAARLVGAASPRFSGPLATAAVALVVAPAFLHHAWGMRATLREPPGWPASIGAACEWMRANLPKAGPRDLVARDATFGPWDWGHHLNVLGGRPVLVDPFNHDERANAPSREIWLARTGAELMEALDGHRVRYVFSTGAYRSAADVLVGEAARVRLPSAPGGVAYVGSLDRFALARFERRGGVLDEEGRLLPLWMSSVFAPTWLAEPDGLRSLVLPLARLYEVVPGAHVEGEAPGYCDEIVLACEVRDADGEGITVQRSIPVTRDGGSFRFAFRTALPAPFATSTFHVPGPCAIVCGGESAPLYVTEAAVREGHVLVVDGSAVTGGSGHDHGEGDGHDHGHGHE